MFLIFFFAGCSDSLQFKSCGGQVVLSPLNTKFYPQDCTYRFTMHDPVRDDILVVYCDTDVGDTEDTYELKMVQRVVIDFGQCVREKQR